MYVVRRVWRGEAFLLLCMNLNISGITCLHLSICAPPVFLLVRRRELSYPPLLLVTAVCMMMIWTTLLPLTVVVMLVSSPIFADDYYRNIIIWIGFWSGAQVYASTPHGRMARNCCYMFPLHFPCSIATNALFSSPPPLFHCCCCCVWPVSSVLIFVVGKYNT